MKVNMNDFGTGWFGVEVGVKKEEIDQLIKLLSELKEGHFDHFTIANKSETQPSGIENFEIFLIDKRNEDNMQILSGNIQAK